MKNSMVRNVYYKPRGALFNVMIGANVTSDFNKQLERGADAPQRTKSDFIRLLLEKGLKAFHDERLPKRESA